MNSPDKPIEEVFFESLIKLFFASIIVVLVVDFYITHFSVFRSAAINFTVLLAILIAYALYKFGHFVAAVLFGSILAMATMFYQSIVAATITTTSMAVVMVIGFIFSVLLRGRLPWFLHAGTLAGMAAIFTWLALHPVRYRMTTGEIVDAAVTYLILYFLIAYSTKALKQRYDEAILVLASKNIELIEKSVEIETQNAELLQSHEKLNNLNNELENIVEERTKQVVQQNEQLISYAYSNAHHVRGPVARLLGLIELSKMETDLDYQFLFRKIEVETLQIDEVVKRINAGLDRDASQDTSLSVPALT